MDRAARAVRRGGEASGDCVRMLAGGVGSDPPGGGYISVIGGID